jgi:hypothetical protein
MQRESSFVSSPYSPYSSLAPPALLAVSLHTESPPRTLGAPSALCLTHSERSSPVAALNPMVAGRRQGQQRHQSHRGGAGRVASCRTAMAEGTGMRTAFRLAPCPESLPTTTSTHRTHVCGIALPKCDFPCRSSIRTLGARSLRLVTRALSLRCDVVCHGHLALNVSNLMNTARRGHRMPG